MIYNLFNTFELFACILNVVAIGSSDCEQPWIEDPSSGHCYQIIFKTSTWSEAFRQCRIIGGNLVSIEWPEEQIFLSDEIGKRCSSRLGLWMGANRLNSSVPRTSVNGNIMTYTNWEDDEIGKKCSERIGLWISATHLHSSGTRTWVNGNIMTYTNGEDGEPNNYNNTEECAEAIPSWHSKWNDFDCDSPEGGHICEKFTPCNAFRPLSLRCLNGGTCHNAGPTAYKCECPPSFTGSDCELDFNECQFNPCQHGASCNNTIGDYNCHCPNKYIGKDCHLEKCQMSRADVVFLVDSSQSQRPDNFKTQLDFIAEFIKLVYIGPDYVQLGVITFSFGAKVEFDLTRYSNKDSLLNALQNIKYNAGSTNTSAALRLAREEVFTRSRPGVRKLAILLTDGMSSNKVDTMDQSALLRNSNVSIVCVGIGTEILHDELLTMTANPNNVFTVSTFDGLYGILYQIRIIACEVCSEKVTDLLYLLDTSGDHSLQQFHGAIDALQSITSFIEIGSNKARVCLVTYASEPKFMFDFRTFTSENEIRQKIQVIDRDSKSVANLTKALHYVRQNGFTTSSGARNDTRQVIVLLTNGKNIDTDAMKEVNLLKGTGKYIVTMTYGKDIARDKLLSVASEPYMFFHLGEELFTYVSVLISMKTVFEYTTCSL